MLNVGRERRRLLRRAAAGVTLIEVVVTLVILGVIASVMVLGVEASSRIGGEQRRIDDAAKTLARLRDAAVRYNLGTKSSDTSFTAKISNTLLLWGGINPGRLSQLTNKITVTDVSSCGYTYNTAYTGRWLRSFYSSPISSTTPLRIADGFYANDVLERFDTLGAAKVFLRTAGADTAKAPGTLAIVMPNVSLADANALVERMEGDQNPASVKAIVRFTPSGSAPVTVRYHMAIHGC